MSLETKTNISHKTHTQACVFTEYTMHPQNSKKQTGTYCIAKPKHKHIIQDSKRQYYITRCTTQKCSIFEDEHMNTFYIYTKEAHMKNVLPS